MIKRDLFGALGLVLVFLPITQQEKLMGWHSSGVTRTRIRVIGINFGEFLIRGIAGNSSYQSSSSPSKNG